MLQSLIKDSRILIKSNVFGLIQCTMTKLHENPDMEQGINEFDRARIHTR